MNLAKHHFAAPVEMLISGEAHPRMLPPLREKLMGYFPGAKILPQRKRASVNGETHVPHGGIWWPPLRVPNSGTTSSGHTHEKSFHEERTRQIQDVGNSTTHWPNMVK